MKDIKERVRDKNPKIRNPAARLPKELVRSAVLEAKEKPRELHEKSSGQSESPTQYGTEKIESVQYRAASVAGKSIGKTTYQGGKKLAGVTYRKIKERKSRQVAGQYAYDDNEAGTDELTLRSGGEEINEQLEQKLNERLAMAGIEVVEARINYLAYAPEIAAVMLRRQQASAIISAREKIVEGAVSMVHMALDKLSQEDIVELDEDKKAAMVSNLLVVLCADEAAQPVVNTGTLNH